MHLARPDLLNAFFIFMMPQIYEARAGLRSYACGTLTFLRGGAERDEDALSCDNL